MENLLEIIAHVEARIDFADEDLPAGDGDIPAQRLAALLESMRALVRTRPYHTLLQEGARAVILGAPNAGKSTLLNTLLGEERALVSPEAGTTRDYIVERRRVGDYCVQFIDTAGVRQNADGLEAAGIARTLEKLADCDCCLLVVDAGAPPPDFPQAVCEALCPEKTLLVENKIDLPNKLGDNYLGNIKRRLRVSLKTGENVAALEGEIVRLLESGIAIPSGETVAVNARQAAALEAAVAALETAASQHARGTPPEFVASDLHSALDALGEILGRVENERILDRIFSTFCIGK